MAICINAYVLFHSILPELGKIETQDPGQKMEGVLLWDLKASSSGSAPLLELESDQLR